MAELTREQMKEEIRLLQGNRDCYNPSHVNRFLAGVTEDGKPTIIVQKGNRLKFKGE